MRCFLAIRLPEDVRKKLVEIQKQLPEGKMKLVEEENLHLTLKFFGEISDFQINKIKRALEQVKMRKLEARLGKLGVFPSINFVRVIWIGVEPAEEIKKMQEEIDSLLEKEKFRREKKFESHITLARVKSVKDKKEFIKKLKEIIVEPIKFSIEKFSLEKSTLTSKGPIYETIKEFELS